MGIENFITEALYKPNDYIAYYVGRQLAELHPEKAVIQGQTGYFDLEAFVRAGHCSVVEQKSVFHHVKNQWEGTGEKLREKTENSWLNVLWQGHLMDVVLITWTVGCYRGGITGSSETKEKFPKTSSRRFVNGLMKFAARFLFFTTATFKKMSNCSIQLNPQPLTISSSRIH